MLIGKETNGPRFEKLDAAGNVVDTDHIMVRDNATDLVWLVAYLAKGKEITQEKAALAAAALDVGGHQDWRLPTRFELESLIDLSRCNPAIDVALFPGTKSDWHWSSSSVAGPSGYAWLVYFDYGFVDGFRRDGGAFARAVRRVPASQ